MSLNKPSLLPKPLSIFAQEAFFHEGVVIKGVRYRIAGMYDLKHLLSAERQSWGAGTESEQAIAFTEDDIKGQLEDFPGLQVVALHADTDQALGWSCMIRVPRETNIENVPDSDEMYAKRTPKGERFEAMGVAVSKELRGNGIGRKLMISRQAGVAQKIVEEALAEYGSREAVERYLDNIMAQMSSTASIRMPGYGAWLREKDLNVDTLERRQVYLDEVKAGRQRDKVLNANLAVVKETQGLAEILNVKGGCLKDLDSAGAGLRGENTRLVREYARLILRRGC